MYALCFAHRATCWTWPSCTGRTTNWWNSTSKGILLEGRYVRTLPLLSTSECTKAMSRSSIRSIKPGNGIPVSIVKHWPLRNLRWGRPQVVIFSRYSYVVMIPYFPFFGGILSLRHSMVSTNASACHFLNFEMTERVLLHSILLFFEQIG
jgi:hypothetical protein